MDSDKSAQYMIQKSINNPIDAVFALSMLSGLQCPMFTEKHAVYLNRKHDNTSILVEHPGFFWVSTHGSTHTNTTRLESN